MSAPAQVRRLRPANGHNGILMAETTALRPWPKLLAGFSLYGVIIYTIVDIVLKFLRPQYSLIYNAESDYGRGPWFWVMDLNFLLRCILSLALLRSLALTVRPDSRLKNGLVLLGIWAVGSGLLAFFADDIEGQPVHGSGVVHLVLAFIAFVCITISVVLVSIAIRADPAWRSVSTILWLLSLLGVVAFLLLGAALHHKRGPDGLYERIFLGVELLWMAIASGFVVTRDHLWSGFTQS